MRNTSIFNLYGFTDDKINFQISGNIAVCKGLDKERFSRKDFGFYVFEFITKGQGYLIENSYSFDVNENDLYILQKDSNHEFFPNIDNPWHKTFIVISGSIIGKLIHLLNLEEIYYIEKFNNHSIFKKILNQLKIEPNNKPKLLILFFELLMLIREKININEKNKIYSSNTLLIKKYIDTHTEDKLSIEKLSNIINKSPSQINRIFKKETGYTPYDYHLNRKIEIAKVLLTNSKENIKVISRKLNLSDEFYFSNIFKAKTGLSPKNYKKEYLEH